MDLGPGLQLFQHINVNGLEHKEEILPIKINNEFLDNKLQTLSVPITPFQLIQQFSSIFAFDKYDVGLISTSRCNIELNSHVLINLRPYRCNPKEREILKEQIQNLINRKLIQKSTSQYAFPVTMVKKKDADKKELLCVDFRKLNAITAPDNHPFPRIEDIMDQLHDNVLHHSRYELRILSYQNTPKRRL